MTVEITPDISTEVTPDTGTVYASCRRRFGAMIIDTVIGLAFCAALLEVVGLKWYAYQATAQIATLAYYVAFESSSWRATLGKRLLGIYLADKEGNRISPLRSLARYLVLYAPGLPLVWLMCSDKYIAFHEGMQNAKQLSSAEQHAAFTTLFHENSALMGHLLIIVAGSCVVSILLYWLPMIFTKQKTGLHDIITNVRVLRKTRNNGF